MPHRNFVVLQAGLGDVARLEKRRENEHVAEVPHVTACGRPIVRGIQHRDMIAVFLDVGVNSNLWSLGEAPTRESVRGVYRLGKLDSAICTDAPVLDMRPSECLDAFQGWASGKAPTKDSVRKFLKSILTGNHVTWPFANKGASRLCRGFPRNEPAADCINVLKAFDIKLRFYSILYKQADFRR